MRLYRDGKTWYADITVGNVRERRSTRCTDRRAAEVVAKQWEREAADPNHTSTHKAALGDALQLLIDDRNEQVRAGRKSASTASFYEKKTGHWTRLLETDDKGEHSPFLLAKLEASHVDDYITTRRNEGAGESTISKELITLRAALKIAKRKGIWKGDVDEVLPIGFAPDYKPRERALSPAEARLLLDQLAPDRAARVAFIIATSANWKESELARREDVTADRTQVLIRGTKRSTRYRVVPIVAGFQKELLEFALEHARGPGDPMFTCWENVRRDLDTACRRIERDMNPGFDHGPEKLSKKLRKVPPNPFASVSPNDLRRTCSTWLRALGVPPHLIAPVMGHKDSRMVERVYGRLPVDDLAKRIRHELREDGESGRSAEDAPKLNVCENGMACVQDSCSASEVLADAAD